MNNERKGIVSLVEKGTFAGRKDSEGHISLDRKGTLAKRAIGKEARFVGRKRNYQRMEGTMERQCSLDRKGTLAERRGCIKSTKGKCWKKENPTMAKERIYLPLVIVLRQEKGRKSKK